jgi:hypothetical protein
MDKWINVTALWQIVVVGLLAGAGLPAVFAVGVRVLSPAAVPARPVGAGDTQTATRNPAAVAAAALCFALVLAGIAYGLYLIVSAS